METPSPATLQFASEILRKIKSNILKPEELTMEQRRICVRFMVHNRDLTKTEMGEILKVHRKTIHEDCKALAREEVGASLMIDEIETIRELIQSAELAIAKLFRKGNEKDAFEVHDKLVNRLQTLGYVRLKPKEFRFDGQISLLEVLKFEQSYGIGSSNGNGHAGNGNGAAHDSGGARLEETPDSAD